MTSGEEERNPLHALWLIMASMSAEKSTRSRKAAIRVAIALHQLSLS